MKKKTVVLHPLLDRFVRQTQAILLEDEVEGEASVDATYSAAVNFMLLAAIHEAERPDGWSPETREVVWNFAHDPATIHDLNLRERLATVRQALARGGHVDKGRPGADIVKA